MFKIIREDDVVYFCNAVGEVLCMLGFPYKRREAGLEIGEPLLIGRAGHRGYRQ